ncbi:MAG: metal-dependent hydrolase [Dissulfurimicrobium sp.]|uniref:metal-dependent hydrolase n=1 Tax=Dissulfurimicrobium sp. TaxID=2022436 RepID=UPI004049EC6A
MAGLHIDFFGHSAFKITSPKGLKVWIDPWLENPLAPKDAKANAMREQADLILVTHAHGDHLGNVLSMARSSTTEVVAIHEIQQYLLSSGLPNVTGMNIGGAYSTKGLKIIMTHAVHSSSIQQSGNDIIYGGTAVGFVIKFEDETAVYHAGDTALFSDMSLIGQLYRPKIAMLPIGDHYVMGPKEAAHAARFTGADIIIPMHYGTFPVLTGTVTEFQKEVNALGVKANIIPLAPGEGLDF